MSGPVFDPAGSVERLDGMRAELGDLLSWIERAGGDAKVRRAVADAKAALAYAADEIEAETWS